MSAWTSARSGACAKHDVEMTYVVNLASLENFVIFIVRSILSV